MILVEGDWAIWCAIVRYAGLNAAGENLRVMENRISWSLKRSAAEWLIVHEHSSAPVDFETLK
jgi:ketosteroid isomerase-like protein